MASSSSSTFFRPAWPEWGRTKEKRALTPIVTEIQNRSYRIPQARPADRWVFWLPTKRLPQCRWAARFAFGKQVQNIPLLKAKSEPGLWRVAHRRVQSLFPITNPFI